MDFCFASKKTMSKSNYYFGQSVLGQVFKLIPDIVVNKSVKQHQSDFACKRFNTATHLKTMCYAVLSDVTGLRHVSDGLLGMGSKLGHLGLNYVPPKSTLSDANKNRSSEVFGSIYTGLYKYYSNFFSDSSVVEPLLRKAYAIDATTVSLFKDILKASGRKSKDGQAKGGMKAHTQISLVDELPINIKYTSGATHDQCFFESLQLQKDDIAIMDKAYVNYNQFATWAEQGIYFVTREKDNAKSIAVLEKDLPDDKDFEILLDEQALYHYKDSHNQTQQLLLRRVVVYSEKHKESIVLLTNAFHLEAAQISLLYRKRWRIELLFKQLKQNFPLKYFVGDNQNAIEIQIWCALIINMLMTLIRIKANNKKLSFALMVSIIRQHTMSYINIIQYLKHPEGLRLAFKKLRKNNNNAYQEDLFFNTT